MHKITFPVEARESETVLVVVAFVGAGAANGTVPASHRHVLTSATRAPTGIYTLNLKDIYPSYVGIVGQPAVVGPNGAKAFVTAFDADDGIITVQAKNTADAAADLATTDTCYVTVLARNSKVKYGEAA
jgi:hypothetical protein